MTSMGIIKKSIAHADRCDMRLLADGAVAFPVFHFLFVDKD